MTIAENPQGLMPVRFNVKRLDDDDLQYLDDWATGAVIHGCERLARWLLECVADERRRRKLPAGMDEERPRVPGIQLDHWPNAEVAEAMRTLAVMQSMVKNPVAGDLFDALDQAFRNVAINRLFESESPKPGSN